MRPVESWAPLPQESAPAEVPVVAASREPVRLPLLNIVLFAATLATTTIAGAFGEGVALADLRERWTSGLPFSLTLMSILLAHEMGHYLLARFHGVRVTLPFFLPGPPIPPLPGTFGAFIRMKSPPQNRRVLFDVGAAGPWAGFLVAVPAVVYGLHLSEIHPIPPSYSGPEFGDSLLFKLLTRGVVGPIPYGFDVVLNPIAFAGWLGLLVTVLNLLPVGQLDGGHVIYAMFGRRHRWIARAFLLVTVGMGFLGWSGWFLWAVMLVLVGLDHPPTVDASVALDRPRLVAGWLTLVLFVMTFIPVPIQILEGGAGPRPEELLPATVWLGG